MGTSAAGRSLNNDAERALEALLERECADLRALIELLEDELDALASGSADDVNACARAKQQLIRQVFHSRDQVDAMARAHGGVTRESSAEAWIARQVSPRIRLAFERLTELAGTARELNQLAARVVHRKLGDTRERLELLVPAASGNDVYASGGVVNGNIPVKGIVGSA